MKNKKPAEQDGDEKDLEDDEEEAEEEESEDEDESESKDEDESEDEEEDESDDEDDSKHLDDEDEDEDLDAELDKEREEDKKKEEARKGFSERKGKKEGKDEEEKPLTRREAEAILADDRKARQEMDALAIAKTLAKSDKAAELIVVKWKNRQFPKHLTLNEQIMEMYGAVYAKKLVGEKNEALRALRNKGRVSKDGSGTHHDAKSKKPKIAPADVEAMKGWEWKENRWEKKLKSGNKLVRDPKTRRTTLVRSK